MRTLLITITPDTRAGDSWSTDPALEQLFHDGDVSRALWEADQADVRAEQLAHELTVARAECAAARQRLATLAEAVPA